MTGYPSHDLFGGLALDADEFDLTAGLLLVVAKDVASGPEIDLLDVEILHVEAEIGAAPRDAVVVPGDHSRHSRQSDARDVHPGDLEMGHEPDARDAPLEMHVVSEQRLSRRRMGAARRPRHWNRAEVPAGEISRPPRTGQSSCTLAGFPLFSMLAFRSSSSQELVRVRYIWRPMSSVSMALHGMGS